MQFQVVVIGGGLAGLLNSILLARQGFKVALVEKKQYPFHKVCGEYISNEVSPFLKRHGLFPTQVSPPQIDRLTLSGSQGMQSTLALPLGGFGVSRYRLDQFWFEEAEKSGVVCFTGVGVEQVTFESDAFKLVLSNQDVLISKLTIGAFGKRTLLDKRLSRAFINARSPYVGVKYHARLSWDPREIALHSFDKGYCGVSAVEHDRVNICYLTQRTNIKKYGSVPEMEEQVLKSNPHLKTIFDNAEFLFDQPLVINEVSFAPKKPVEQHILMSGDAAGLITPLCGNGMAMAIRSAYLLNESINTYFDQEWTRSQLEQHYSNVWKKNFAYRLAVGRKLQALFEQRFAMNTLVRIARQPWLSRFIVRQTHGDTFGG